MHSGDIYVPGDDEIIKEQLMCLENLYDFNMTRPSELEMRETMPKEMFGEIGENCYTESRRFMQTGAENSYISAKISMQISGLQWLMMLTYMLEPEGL